MGQRRRTGVVVVLLGPDGAGKSTLLAGLAEALAHDHPVRTRYAGAYPAGRRQWRVPGMATLAVLARLGTTAAAASWDRQRGRIVLLDRHPLDVLAAPATRRWKAGARRRAIGRIGPRPDLVLVLDAPADQLVARKAEHGVEAIERQRQGYRRLAATVPTARLLDTTAGACAVRSQALRLVGTLLDTPAP